MRKTNTKRKLELKTETIRVLKIDQLAQVAGGDSLPHKVSGANACSGGCYSCPASGC